MTCGDPHYQGQNSGDAQEQAQYALLLESEALRGKIPLDMPVLGKLLRWFGTGEE